MASLNRVILIGNLTRDVELRSIPSGTTVGGFGIAVNRRRKNDAGEWVEEPNFFNVVVWSTLAERCAEYIHKGSSVAVEGRLQSRSWETEDGQKRSAVEIVAENVQFLGGRGEGGGNSSSKKQEPGFTEIGGAAGSESDVPF